MMKWTKCAIRFLRISRPGVRVPSIAPRKTSTRCVLVFLFVCTMEGARTRRRRTAPQAISPVGCCLACGSQWLGMSTVEAVNRKISWLFCFVSHGCTVSARFLHGGCYPSSFGRMNRYPSSIRFCAVRNIS